MLWKWGCVATVFALCGCENPEIRSVRVSAFEDQPKIVTAEIKTASNMRGPHVQFEAVAPTMGTAPNVDMLRVSENGNLAIYQGTAPLAPEYAAMAYGTRWLATVDVPYTVLWQRNHALQSVEFVVGAGHRCSYFDGDLQRQGWGSALSMRPIPERRPPMTRTVPVNWLGNENARASVVTGALGATIEDIPSPIGGEYWIASFGTGTAAGALRAGTGIRLAAKVSHTVSMHIALLVDRGNQNNVPGAEVFEWVYSAARQVEAADWRTIELTFPALPAPVTPSSTVTINKVEINFSNVRNGMQIVLDDVCPMS